MREHEEFRLGQSPLPDIDEEYRRAVGLAYKKDIGWIVEKLLLGISTLVVCEKALVRELKTLIAEELQEKGHRVAYVSADLKKDETRQDQEDQGVGSAPQPAMGIGRRMVDNLYKQLPDWYRMEKPAIIIEHFDLMVMLLDGRTREQAADIVYLLSQFRNVPVLAFFDPTFPLRPIVRDLFTAKREMAGIDREDLWKLLTVKEARLISCHDKLTIRDQLRLYKYVSGVNAIKLRRILRSLPKYFPPSANQEDVETVLKKVREMTEEEQGDLVPEVHLYRSEADFSPEKESYIAGYEETILELKKRVLSLIQARFNADSDAKVREADRLIPRGVLLYGPPGTGKTELAKWLAHQLRAVLIPIRGPELKSMWHGETERAIRSTFAKARRTAPSVVLIDEIDAMTPTRRVFRTSDAETSMVAQFLTEMDGLAREESVIVIGTTNRLDLVDPAFKRPGRFELRIEVGYPEEEDRRQILHLYYQQMGLNLSKDSIEYLVEKTGGYVEDAKEKRRQALRDAIIESKFPANVRELGKEELERLVDDQYRIGRGLRWSGDHLRGICRALLVEKRWQKKQGKKDFDLNDEGVLEIALRSVRERVQPDLSTEGFSGAPPP